MIYLEPEWEVNLEVKYLGYPKTLFGVTLSSRIKQLKALIKENKAVIKWYIES